MHYICIKWKQYKCVRYAWIERQRGNHYSNVRAIRSVGRERERKERKMFIERAADREAEIIALNWIPSRMFHCFNIISTSNRCMILFGFCLLLATWRANVLLYQWSHLTSIIFIGDESYQKVSFEYVRLCCFGCLLLFLLSSLITLSHS